MKGLEEKKLASFFLEISWNEEEKHFEAFFSDFSYKLNGTAEEALLQIHEKGYAEPFNTDHRKVVKVGVEFSAKTRNVKRWLME